MWTELFTGSKRKIRDPATTSKVILLSRDCVLSRTSESFPAGDQTVSRRVVLKVNASSKLEAGRKGGYIDDTQRSEALFTTSDALFTTTLPNGAIMPLIAFGTGSGQNTPTGEAALESAILEGGFRHVDSAMYYDEDWLGSALSKKIIGRTPRPGSISAQPICREDLFITSKIEPSDPDIVWALNASQSRRWLACPRGHVLDAQQKRLNQVVVRMVQQSLSDLRLAKLDLLLAHSAPAVGHHVVPFWRALEYVKNVECLVNNIGVSNFSVQSLESLRQHGCEVPVVNQIQHHSFFKGMMGDSMLDDCTSQDIITYCEQHRITVMAYSPLQPLSVCDAKLMQPNWFSKKYLTSKKARPYLALEEFFWFNHSGPIRSRMSYRYPNPRRMGRHAGESSPQQVIAHISRDYETTRRTMAQVSAEMLLRWHLDSGRGVVTTSSKPSRAASLIEKVKKSVSGLSRKDYAALDAAPMWSAAFTHYCEYRTYFDEQTGRHIF